MAEAVKRFQDRHGLQPDGLPRGKDKGWLNTHYPQRLGQIKLTLAQVWVL
jgi:murein L,D-transpeptidase YcbB/YkuD